LFAWTGVVELYKDSAWCYAVIDPDELTYNQWFFICLAMVLIVFFLCRWIYFAYQ
jgi:hypothetical protein